MIRLSAAPRQDWRAHITGCGVTLGEATPQWDESACYALPAHENARIVAATHELHTMCERAAEHIVRNRLYESLGIPPEFCSYIESEWEQNHTSIYGRMDLAVGNEGHYIKFLEYNADTPTALIEASLCQAPWIETDIHHNLVAAWAALRGRKVTFTCLDYDEDIDTVRYLRKTAEQAGVEAEFWPLKRIGWNGVDFITRKALVDVCFKLYPWEWMLREYFAKYLTRSRVLWIEPVWRKMLMSKAILPLLWKLYPDHPLLLESRYERPESALNWVRKPFFGREGENVTLFGVHSVAGPNETGSFVYQRRAELPCHDGHYPVVGSWVIAGQASGLGIRESTTPITDSNARFVPYKVTD